MSGEPRGRTRVTVTIVVFVLLAVGVFFGVRALVDSYPREETEVGEP